jgi:toxin ParE1/3/4
VTKVVWSDEAIQNLDQIYEYIAQTSQRYAALTLAELFAAVYRLQDFPESGRLVPERSNTALREVIWRSYRIVYEYRRGGVANVLTVFRSERRFPLDR